MTRIQVARAGKNGRTIRTIRTLDVTDLDNKDAQRARPNKPDQRYGGDSSLLGYPTLGAHDELEEEGDVIEDLVSEAYTITTASKKFLSMSVAETRIVPDRRSELLTPSTSSWSDDSPSEFPRTPGLLLTCSDEEEDLEEEDITMSHPATHSLKLLHRQSLMKRHWKMKQIFGDVPPPAMTKTGGPGDWDEFNSAPSETEDSFLDLSRDDVSEIVSLYRNQSEAGDEDDDELSDISQRRVVKLSKFFGVDNPSGLQIFRMS